MKTMTVGELKKILMGLRDEVRVVIDDVNDMCIAIVGGGEIDEGRVHLHTQQEFPEAWFDRNGDEIDWAFNGIKKVTTPDVDEIYLIDDEKTGGREVYAQATFYDGFADGVGFKLTYPKMSELTPDLFRRIDECCGGRCTDSGCVTPQDICVYCGKLEWFGIMDDANGHSKDLVRDINVRWVEDRHMFRPILQALYERDSQEIFKCKEFGWCRDIESVKECMQTEWDLHAETYLKYVADDQDLEAIIKFVRYDRSENA